MNNQTIAEKINRYRKERQLTQEQLGEALGVTGQAVSKWETGASMPDIMLLPELCDNLDISLEEFFEVPTKKKNIISDFCKYACESGRAKAVCDVIARLFNDAGVNNGGSSAFFASDEIRASDERGLGFILSGKEYRDVCRQMKNEDVAYFLKILTDETCLSVLKLIQMEHSITREEISSTLSLDNDMVDRILLGFMKRNIICVERDATGKRGYMQSSGMIGIWMILSGCYVANCGEELGIDNLYLSRK